MGSVLINIRIVLFAIYYYYYDSYTTLSTPPSEDMSPPKDIVFTNLESGPSIKIYTFRTLLLLSTILLTSSICYPFLSVKKSPNCIQRSGRSLTERETSSLVGGLRWRLIHRWVRCRVDVLVRAGGLGGARGSVGTGA